MPEYLITTKVRSEDKSLAVRSKSRATALRFVAIFTKYNWYTETKVEFEGKSYAPDEMGDLP